VPHGEVVVIDRDRVRQRQRCSRSVRKDPDISLLKIEELYIMVKVIRTKSNRDDSLHFSKQTRNL